MRIQPRQFGVVLGDAMNSLARIWQPLLSTALIVFVPLGVLTLVVFNITGALEFLDVAINEPAFLDTITQEEFFQLAEPFFWATGIALVSQGVASLYVYLAAHLIVAADLRGEALPGPVARREAADRFVPGLIAASIVFIAIAAILGAGLTIWLIPFVVVGTPNAASALVALVLLVAVAAPAIWLSVSFSMVTSVVAIEKRTPVAALRRSLALVRPRWWASLGYLLLVGLIGSIAAQLIQVLAIPLTVVGDATSGFTLASLFGVVFQGILIAGIAAMYTRWYVDLRARSEDLSSEELQA